MSDKTPVRVIAKCPKCRALNPTISAEEYGENPTAMMVIFVAHCCRMILGVQLLAKDPNMPKKDSGDLLPV